MLLTLIRLVLSLIGRLAKTVLNARIYLATDENPIVVEVRKFNKIMMVIQVGSCSG